MFRLTLQKRVQFINWRVNVLYWVLLCSTAVVALHLWMSERPWLNRYELKESIRISHWVDGANANRKDFKHTWSRMSNSTLCTSFDRYDYWWDTLSQFTNFSCMTLCDIDVPRRGESCLHQTELSIHEGKHKEFLVTAMQEARPGVDTSSETEFGGYDSFFNPFVEGLRVAFNYQYTLVSQPWYGRYDMFHTATTETFSSSNQLWTVILDSKDKPWKILQPTNKIVISVPELFMLAGRSDFLDEPQPWAGANKMPEAQLPHGPIGRISGCTLKLLVVCEVNNWMDGASNVNGQIPPEARACQIKIKLEEDAWVRTDRTKKASMSRGSLHTLYRGVRVEYEAHGWHTTYSASSAFVYLTSIVVLMNIPTKLMRLFVTMCLGRTSEVYRRTLNEIIDLPHDIGGMLMRLMSHSVSFAEMEDNLNESDETVSDNRFISRAQVTDKLQAVLSTRTPMLGEAQDNFLSFCFRCAAMDAHETDKHRSPILANLKKLATFGGSQTVISATKGVDMDNFMSACSSNEKFSISDICRLFVPRRIGPLEKLFMPGALRRYIYMSPADLHDLGHVFHEPITRSNGLTDLQKRQQKARMHWMQCAVGDLMDREVKKSERLEQNDQRINDMWEDFEARKKTAAKSEMQAPSEELAQIRERQEELSARTEQVVHELKAALASLEARLADATSHCCSAAREPVALAVNEELRMQTEQVAQEFKATLTSLETRLADAMERNSAAREPVALAVTEEQRKIQKRKPKGNQPRRESADWAEVDGNDGVDDDNFLFPRSLFNGQPPTYARHIRSKSDSSVQETISGRVQI